nr:EamA family transporter RarD [Spelaeicoccus albus]
MLFGMLGYVSWGFIPLYFAILEPAGSIEIVAHRVLWCLVLCAIALIFTRGYRRVFALMRSPRVLLTIAAASVFIAGNWLTYVYGVMTGRVVEVSLGYFINPLFTVLLGVVVLRERLSRTQWAAVIIGTVAVIVIAVAYGRLPWLALVVAFSFGMYGLLKNRVGKSVGSLEGLSIESLVLTPISLAYVLWIEAAGHGTFTGNGAGHTLLLMGLGAVTAIPLLLFGAGARRLPLVWMGMLQYITPIMQFVLGVTVFGEHMAPARWIGFFLVWTALAVLTTDMLRRRRQRQLRSRARANEPCEDAS